METWQAYTNRAICIFPLVTLKIYIVLFILYITWLFPHVTTLSIWQFIICYCLLGWYINVLLLVCKHENVIYKYSKNKRVKRLCGTPLQICETKLTTNKNAYSAFWILHNFISSFTMYKRWNYLNSSQWDESFIFSIINCDNISVFMYMYYMIIWLE